MEQVDCFGLCRTFIACRVRISNIKGISLAEPEYLTSIYCNPTVNIDKDLYLGPLSVNYAQCTP